jgi:hypothetical protein
MASRRLQFGSRCMQLLAGNRRAARASARGPWPCSLGDVRWADRNIRGQPQICQRVGHDGIVVRLTQNRRERLGRILTATESDGERLAARVS